MGNKRATWLTIVLIFNLWLSACASQPDAPPIDDPATARPTRAAPTRTRLAHPTLPPTLPPPSPTPAPALRRLTEPGCCTQPTWSLDSRQVIFIDKPSPDAPAGLYAVDVTRPGAAPTLLTERLLAYSPDLQAAAYPKGNTTVVERIDTGQRWELDTRGNPPALSPDKARLVWENTADAGPYDARRTDIYVAELDDASPQPELALTVYGGGLVAWFPDSLRVLIVARPALTSEERLLATFSLDDHSMIELARAQRISGITLSPGGTWAAYFVSFAQDEKENGLWVVRTDGTLPRRLELFGSYQWRNDAYLLAVPMAPGAVSHEVWQVEAATGAAARLTDPALTPFKIANGDWCVSPDGRRIVFVNAQDKALWLLTFPLAL